MKAKGLVGGLVGIAISVVVLSVTVFYASTAWRKGQRGEKLI